MRCGSLTSIRYLALFGLLSFCLATPLFVAADELDDALSAFLDDTGQVSPQGALEVRTLLQKQPQRMLRLLAELEPEDAELTAPLLELLPELAVDSETRWPLERFLESREERVRLATLQLLRTQPQRSEMRHVWPMLSDASPEVRRSAARVLGVGGDSDSTPYLRRAIRDSHRLVRYAAVNALGELNDADAVPQLLMLADNDSDGFLARCARLALTKINSPACLDFMVKLLQTGDTRARAAALQGLTRTESDPKLKRQRLERALNDPAPWVQEQAVELLLLTYPLESRVFVLEWLRSDDAALCQSAQRCLVRVADPDLTLLVRLMTPPFAQDNRQIAIQVLVEALHAGTPPQHKEG